MLTLGIRHLTFLTQNVAIWYTNKINFQSIRIGIAKHILNITTTMLF